jgi:hypothetical protein
MPLRLSGREARVFGHDASLMGSEGDLRWRDGLFWRFMATELNIGDLPCFPPVTRETR